MSAPESSNAGEPQHEQQSGNSDNNGSTDPGDVNDSETELASIDLGKKADIF